MNGLNKAWNWVLGLLGLGDSPAKPEQRALAPSGPKKFYHGTQTAIHLLPNTYLDPKFATGGDEGDPKLPHVFVTPDKLMAKIFALKTQNVVGISITHTQPIIVFSSDPHDCKGGWIYSCPENPKKPFEEIIVRGQHSNKWVSYDKVPITEPEYVPSLEHLMQHDHLQAYVLKEGTDIKQWNEQQRDAVFGGKGLDQLFAEQLKAGNIRDLNAERGISSHTINYRDDWSKRPNNQPGHVAAIAKGA